MSHTQPNRHPQTPIPPASQPPRLAFSAAHFHPSSHNIPTSSHKIIAKQENHNSHDEKYAQGANFVPLCSLVLRARLANVTRRCDHISTSQLQVSFPRKASTNLFVILARERDGQESGYVYFSGLGDTTLKRNIAEEEEKERAVAPISYARICAVGLFCWTQGLQRR